MNNQIMFRDASNTNWNFSAVYCGSDVNFSLENADLLHGISVSARTVKLVEHDPNSEAPFALELDSNAIIYLTPPVKNNLETFIHFFNTVTA